MQPWLCRMLRALADRLERIRSPLIHAKVYHGRDLIDEVSATAEPFAFKQALNAVACRVCTAPSNLTVRIDPESARLLAESPDVIDHLKAAPWSLASIRGDDPSPDGAYGLPDYLWGYRLVVIEPTAKPEPIDDLC